MKFLGWTEDQITNDQNGENVPHLEVTKLPLLQCKISNSDYQHKSRVLYTFVPNKSFCPVLEISFKELYIFNTI